MSIRGQNIFFSAILFAAIAWPQTSTTELSGAVYDSTGAVVVGAILDLTLFLGKTAFFPSGVATLRGVDAASLLWAIFALVLLLRFNLNVILLVLMSVAFGLARSLLAI